MQSPRPNQLVVREIRPLPASQPASQLGFHADHVNGRHGSQKKLDLKPLLNGGLMMSETSAACK
jgi:hypothetical protein